MNEILLLGVGLVFFIVLFLVFRGMVLWYWNVTKIISNQERTNQLLCKVVNALEKDSSIEKAETESTVISN